MFLLIVLGLIVLACSGVYLWNRRHLYLLDKKLSGPFAWPIIGNGLLFSGGNEHILSIIANQFKKHGSPYRFWLGPKLFVLVDHPDDVQIVLNSPNSSHKDTVYKFLECFGEAGGLITINSDTWKYHRKNLNPCFNMKILESYLPIFNYCSKIMIQNLEKVVDKGEEYNIESDVHACSLDMICETTMGTRLNIQNNVNHDMLIASDRVLNIVTSRFFKVWLHPDFIYRRSKYFFQEQIYAKYVQKFARDVLNKNKAKISSQKSAAKVNKSNSDDDEEKNPQIFISQLLKISRTSDDEFTDSEVVAETITTIMAGNETSGNAIANALLLLAMHSDIQDKVIKEMKSVFKGQDSEVTAEDCKQLVYLEMVIKEGMRLLPIVPLFVRETTGDVTLQNGVTVPKGVHICVANFSTHRRKDLWGENADQFNPENFAPDRERHPYSYVPFSGGPRICIGYKYAFLSMKVILAYLLRRYKFKTNLNLEDLRWELSVTLRLLNKHMVTLERRKW